MSHYRPYPAYKDSGLEWLGQVPEHWKVSSVKWEFESRLGKMLQPRPNNLTDFEVPYHKAVSVQWEKIALEAPEAMWASASDVETYQVCKGDLLICEGGDVGRAAIFQDVDSEPLIIQNSLHRVRPRNENLNEGLLRIMQVVRAAGWFDVLCSKATIVHFTGEKLGSLAYPVAPAAEQRLIAAHLDRETARIDGLVAKKTRFIELLREKRQALITHAVTKGLDPNAKMKDSGVEWLGEVPEHWRVKRLRYVASLNPLVKTRLLPDAEVSFLPMEAIGKDGSINLEKTRPVAEVRNGYSYFEDGDVTFAKVTPCFENGKGAVMRDLIGGLGFGTTELTVLRPNPGTDVSFINYLLQSDRFRLLGEGAMTGAGGLKRVPDEFTRNFEAPWPMFSEQQVITAYLDRETTRIDTLISKTNRSIELLKERRSALITAAVTGQIDLREAG